jgi:hypothetical protein
MHTAFLPLGDCLAGGLAFVCEGGLIDCLLVCGGRVQGQV